MRTVKASFVNAMAVRLDMAGYTDRPDISPETSLAEYGMMRNPKTGRVQYAGPVNSDETEYVLSYTVVNMDDVKEFLAEAPDDFYSFVGQSYDEYVTNLSPDNLSGAIQDANMWSGYFQ